MALLWVALAAALGCAVVYGRLDFGEWRPRWAAWLVVMGAGLALGIGLTGTLFFLNRWLLPGAPQTAKVVELAVLAWAAYGAWRKWRVGGGDAAQGEGAAPLGTAAVLVGVALGLTLAAATGGFVMAVETNPQGQWDAWSIWNLRARLLMGTGADGAARAWSPVLSATHPEYPLLTSSFVARCWVYAGGLWGGTAEAAPQAMAYLFLVALIALATGAVSILRGRVLGLLFGVVLLATPALWHEAPAQYADVPLACYFAGAMLLALLERPLVAGAMAGCAAWTKDEGLLFLAVFFGALLLWRRAGFVRAAMGAAPVAGVALVFKAVLAAGTATIVGRSLPGVGARLGEVGRYIQIAGAFLGEFLGMMAGGYHPVLPLVALAVALRFEMAAERRRDLWFCGGVAGLMLAGYFGVYVTTSNALSWQLETSLGRVMLQVWPLVALTVFLGLRTPESLAPVVVEAEAVGAAGVKAKRKRGR